jgi:hypothetical protein
VCLAKAAVQNTSSNQNNKEKAMKTITASLFALVLSAPLALADGCGMHGEQKASMSCATGQAWDAEAKQCVDTSA